MKGKVENRQCKLCELHRGCKTVCLGGRGANHPTIMVVSEAPGRDEDEQGKNFIGRLGTIFMTALKCADVHESKVFFTSLVRCKIWENATPSFEQITMCRGYLMKEAETIKPKSILCLGRTSVLGFFPNYQANLKGRKFYVGDWKGIPVYVTYHPSAVLRNSLLFEEIVITLRKVVRETERRSTTCNTQAEATPKKN